MTKFYDTRPFFASQTSSVVMSFYLSAFPVTTVALCFGIALAACNKTPAKDWIAECDMLAADPHDPNRRKAGVPDTQVAVGAAVEACQAAVKDSPTSARSWYQLGRSQHLAERHELAFEAYREASKLDYAPSMKAIGDAYLDGRGLPLKKDADSAQAKAWYKRSAEAGYEDGKAALIELERKSFDPGIFNRADFMKTIYEGDFSRLSAPVTFLIYAYAFNQQLSSEQVSFIDQECTPLATEGGNIVLGGGGVLAFLKMLKDDKQSQVDAGAAIVAMPLLMDQGKRDAMTMINRYGCKSAVGKRIVGNTNLSYAKIRENLRQTGLGKN